MISPVRWLVCAAMAALAHPAAAAVPPTPPIGPNALLSSAPASEWRDVPADDLLVMDLAGGGRVVIALADAFAPVHVANIRALARAHWYDGLVVERVQDDYVAQWGDPDDKKPLPPNVSRVPAAEYERPAAGVALHPLPYSDTYAPKVGVSGAFPVASDGEAAWLTHCYGMVGVGRDLNPDTGSGGELYAVIGGPIRTLDRNIAVVGRVVAGIEALSALPRGTGDLGFYTDPKQRVSVLQVRLATDLPIGQRPRLQVLRADGATYAAWVHARANRRDSFFLRPAGALDVCHALPPVRPAPL